MKHKKINVAYARQSEIFVINVQIFAIRIKKIALHLSYFIKGKKNLKYLSEITKC